MCSSAPDAQAEDVAALLSAGEALPAFGAGEGARRIVETSSRIDAPVPRRLNAAAVGL